MQQVLASDGLVPWPAKGFGALRMDQQVPSAPKGSFSTLSPPNPAPLSLIPTAQRPCQLPDVPCNLT